MANALSDSVQTISGTGANHLGGLFLERFYVPWQGKSKEEKVVYLSNPTWANHKAIFANIGCTTKDYPYYDKETIGLAYDKFIDFLQSAPQNSVILLHACAHNPTGVDPTRDQWKEIAQVFASKGHFAFFDCAYQGFASGDLENDAWAVRHFVDRKIPLLVCQSYAKNAGLYGERIGALNIVAAHQGDGEGGAKRLASQLLVLVRSEISNPPTFGARIVRRSSSRLCRIRADGAVQVSMILNDKQLFEDWKRDIETMAHRIIKMRKDLYELLTNEFKTPPPGSQGWKQYVPAVLSELLTEADLLGVQHHEANRHVLLHRSKPYALFACSSAAFAHRQ